MRTNRNRTVSYSLLIICVIVVSNGYGFGQDFRDRDGAAEVEGRAFGGEAEARYLPPGSNRPSQYRLGVSIRNTQTGVVLTNVQPRSAAQKAGLERDDVVITVEGYQVGYVQNRLFDLGDEIAKRVDRRGRVTLLVKNHRDGRLVNVPVNFDETENTITKVAGVISTQNNLSLSRSAILSIRVVDVTHGNWQNVVIQEINTQAPRSWPTQYRVDVHNDKVLPGHRYGVEAEVRDRGRVVLETRRPTSIVDTNNVDMVLIPAQNRPAGGLSPLDQIQQWYLDYLGRKPTERELSTWQFDLERGGSLEDIQASILSSSEYYERNQGDRGKYVDDLYSRLSGKQPTDEQRDSMRQQLEKQKDVRLRFAQELMRQIRESGGNGADDR